MAREAGFSSHHNPDLYDCMVASDKAIERFAELVRAAERDKWMERTVILIRGEREHYDDLFDNIKNWCEAYPIAVFPEPDFKKAHEVLKAHGMTLDAISASNMKHVITQVQKMIDAAIRARGQK
jgi:DNA-binding FadR family transcriptional regulator